MRFYYATGNKDQSERQYLGNFKTFVEAERELYQLTKDLGVPTAFLYVPTWHFSIFAKTFNDGSRFKLVRTLQLAGSGTVKKERETGREIRPDVRILRKAS